jgi:hypothetical protein
MLDLDYIKFVSSSRVQRDLRQSHDYDQEVLQRIPDGKWHDYFYKGTANGNFEDNSASSGFDKPTLSNGAAYADLDNDGDLDLVINRVNEEAGIYQNNSVEKNYLQLVFKGDSANKFGVGTKAYLFTKKGMQMQELMLTRGFQSSVPPILHFGLDTLNSVDSIIIVWLGDRSQTLQNVKANQKIEVQQTAAKDTFHFSRIIKPVALLLQDVTAQTGLSWKHRENAFFDFNRQFLIPHMLSTEGPKMAVGDVNGDGLDDVFICGARQQASAMFIQNSKGKFELSNQKVFAADSSCEDVDAVFFDTDNDKDLDLYVVSGGNEYNNGDTLLLDRLYLNNGKGVFIKAINSLPLIAENKSCVRTADINNDGFADLFIGGRSDPSAYGHLPKCYILLNNGKGNFTDASSQWFGPLQRLGMITNAVFNDFNKDGKMDLVVVGDWKTPTFLRNNGKGFTDITSDISSTKLNGWWYFINAADVDNDGDTDFVLGNYGSNSKLQASVDFPLCMYLADLDGNGNQDQLLCVNKNGKYYPFLHKEELEKQLPIIKKKFLEYGSMAGKTAEEIFGKEVLDKTTVLNAYNLQSGILVNDGTGKFSWAPFPPAVQIAPVFSILPVDLNYDGYNELLGGGNFYGVLPYEGRYDASNPWVLRYRGNEFSSSFNPSPFFLTGEIRDIKVVRSVNGSRYIIVARNSDFIKIYR